MREKSTIGLFAVKNSKSDLQSKSLNEYIRQIEQLSYQVSNLRAVRPSEAVEMALVILDECSKKMKAINHQPSIFKVVNQFNQMGVNDQHPVNKAIPMRKG